jgi:hypothetical protein
MAAILGPNQQTTEFEETVDPIMVKAYRDYVLSTSQLLFARFMIMKYRTTPEEEAANAVSTAEMLANELFNRGYIDVE